jgi:hypothetical protein
MKLTTDQKETLKEIPGYVRRDMLYNWIEKSMEDEIKFNCDDAGYREGFLAGMRYLKISMDLGVI